MAAVLSYQTTAQDGSTLTTYTFTSQAIGTAASDRFVIVGIFGAVVGGAAAQTISTVTIGGISATVAVQANSAVLGDSTTGLAIAAVPTGTTATVAITFSGAMARCSIGVWSCVGLGNATAISTGTSLASPGSITLSTSADGFAIGMIGQNAASSYSWTNLTDRFDTTVGGGGYSGADSNGTTNGSSLAISCTYSVADTRRSMVAAAWGNTAPNVSGVSGSGAAGTVSAEVDKSLTGVNGTGAAGTVIPQVGTSMSGVAGTGQVGTVTLTSSIAGVFGTGQVGSVTPSGAFSIIGVNGVGAVGAVVGVDGAIITGVAAVGEVGNVYPIPPAPVTRPPLFIPSENGFPASLWLGSSNGN